jgi:hypothetical protein
MTGCGKNNSSDKKGVWNVLGSKKKPDKPELIKLKNGVFVYKDNEQSEMPPDYNDKNPFNKLEKEFGPSGVTFNGEKSL